VLEFLDVNKLTALSVGRSMFIDIGIGG